MDGYNANTYGPSDPVTREQLAVILWRYAKFKGWDVAQRDGLTAYTDAEDVSEWAREAVQWAVGAGILNGNGGKLNPKAGATRAKLAGMLQRPREALIKSRIRFFVGQAACVCRSIATFSQVDGKHRVRDLRVDTQALH